jgi:fatty acid desaturase
MAESHSAWYKTLDPAKKQAIREMHRINPYWNLVGVMFVVLWTIAATVMVYFPYPWILVPGYLLVGILIHGMANLMHEGIHGTLFRHRRWDHWFGFVMAAPSLFSITAYGVNHLLHHRHNRTQADPDEFTNVTDSRPLLAVFYYVWIVIGMAIYSLRVPYVAITQGSAKERRQVVFEHSLLLLSLAGVVFFCWQRGCLNVIVHVWLIPLGVAALLGNIRGWAEHTRTQAGHPLTETRTITSNRLFSLFNINLNYHLEHHLFPGVPWYNLPKVHRLLLDEYEAAGSSIYRSYSRFMFDAFRTGIFGTPDTKRRLPSTPG